MKNIIRILVCLFFTAAVMLIPISASASSKSSPFYLTYWRWWYWRRAWFYQHWRRYFFL